MENYGHYEERKVTAFEEMNRVILRNYMKNNGNRYVFFDFSIGDKSLDKVVIELFVNECPKTCENFLSLCKGTKNSKNEFLSYENSTVNRIVKTGYLQGGDLKQRNIGNE